MTVEEFPGQTKAVLPVDKVLEGAKGKVVCDVVVFGFDEEGDVYFAASNPDLARINWLLELVRRELLLLWEHNPS